MPNCLERHTYVHWGPQGQKKKKKKKKKTFVLVCSLINVHILGLFLRIKVLYDFKPQVSISHTCCCNNLFVNSQEILAAKVIKTDGTTDRNKSLVDREIQLHKELREKTHQNIVKYVDHVTQDGATCVIMEFCDGGNLHKYIRDSYKEKKAMTESEFVRILKQLAAGLQVCDMYIFTLPVFSATINIQGRIQNLHCRGGTSDQWSRGLHWGAKRRKGEGGGGGHPLPQVGVRGASPGIFFEKLHQNGAFWVHFEVINTRFLHWKFIWKKCVSLNLHMDYSYFFFKILRNLHQNGTFWAHIN